MTRWVNLCAIPLLCAAAVVLARLVWALARRPGSICQGPALSWTRALWPLRTNQCAYDLRGLPLTNSALRCPECGTVQGPGRLAWGCVAARVLCAGLLILAAGACWKVAWIRSGRWARRLPTTVLIWMDYLPMPQRVEGVLLERLGRGAMSAAQRCAMARLAVYNLRSDHRARNAFWSEDVLVHLDGEAIPYLEATLHDAEHQRRQVAAILLRRRDRRSCQGAERPEVYDAPDILFDVSIEAMRDDRLGWENASDAYRFLESHPDRTLPRLTAGMRSGDGQLAFLSALLAGFLHAEDLAPVAAPILVDHLRDNLMEADARIAAPAMVALGQAGRPYLVPLLHEPDAQARELAIAIARAIDHQPVSDHDRRVVRSMTCKFDDLRAAASHSAGLWDGFLR